MEQALIIRGRYAGRTFIADGPLPDGEGAAELIITPIKSEPTVRHSIAESIGKAPVMQSGDEILARIKAERDDWSDR